MSFDLLLEFVYVPAVMAIAYNHIEIIRLKQQISDYHTIQDDLQEIKIQMFHIVKTLESNNPKGKE